MNSRQHTSKTLTGLALAILTMHTAHAQTPLDAGALQQQIERERQQQLPKRIAPDKPATPAAMKPTTGMTIIVKQFRFTGNTLMTTEQLASKLADYLNRPLDFAQLQSASAVVAEAYRAGGWVVNAYLPQQDIQDGIVTIQIIEAVFGKLKMEGAPAKRVAPSQIDAIFAAQQQAGAILDANALDRALLLADDLPGITVAGSLTAGSQVGYTDLALKMADEPLIIGEATLDNTGARSTGSERLTANLNLTSPFGLGDLLTSNLIHSQGNDYLRLGYTVPVGGDGLRIGANASHLAYDLIGTDFKGLDAQGTSDTAGIDVSYPVVRSRLANLYLYINYDHKRFNNESGGATTTRYTVDAINVAFNGNLFDNWGGGGSNSASLDLTSGSRGNDVGVTNDHFNKLRYRFSRQQVITNTLSFYGALNGQESNHELDSSEQFYLGGAWGVRAYPSSEGGGDSGLMTNLELRWMLPEGFILTGFHDFGHVRNNDAAMSYRLKGYGMSLGWQTPVGVNLKATWAHRIGDNPNPTPAGKDQDGSLNKNRLWLSASLPF